MHHIENAISLLIIIPETDIFFCKRKKMEIKEKNFDTISRYVPMRDPNCEEFKSCLHILVPSTTHHTTAKSDCVCDSCS